MNKIEELAGSSWKEWSDLNKEYAFSDRKWYEYRKILDERNKEYELYVDDEGVECCKVKYEKDRYRVTYLKVYENGVTEIRVKVKDPYVIGGQK